MDLQTMVSECRQIIGQPDQTNSNFSDTQLTTWANEFYRKASVNLETLPIKERTYTSAEEITMNSGTIAVDKAKFLVQPANKWVALKIIDLDDLYVMDADWEHKEDGVPTHMVRMGTFLARLYPGPNAANDAQADGVKTHGLEFMTPLSGDTDVPDLPANIQDIFPYWMAHRCFMRLGDTTRMVEQLAMVNNTLKEQKQITTRFSKSRGWVWSEDLQAAEVEGLNW